MKNSQSNIQNDRSVPALVRTSLLVLLALLAVFIPTRAFGQDVWTAQDIGTPPTAGSSVLNGSNVVVSGSGALWGTADTGQFYYQTLNGDGQIIAHVQSVTNPGKTGVMIRQNLTPGSQEVSVLMSGTYGPAFEVRAVASGTTTNPVWDSGSTPVWFKLVRSGSTITGYTSPDSLTWTLLSSTTCTLTTPFYIGLVSSGNNSLTATTFNNVEVTENDLLTQGGTFSFDNDAGNVVSIDQPAGNLMFNDNFKEPNSSYTGAQWSTGTGGLNLSGCVQTSTGTGYVFYDTSVTPGTGNSPGSGGTDANMFQNGTFMLSFSLPNYQSSANEAGIFFRVDSGTVGNGNNGYAIIAKPVASGSNYVFQYTLWGTSDYAPYGTGTGGKTPLATYTSTATITSPASQFYTLGVTVSTNTFTAQIYDATGASVAGKATFTNSTNANAGMAGFLLSGTGTGNGATAYQFGITPTGTASVPEIKYVQAGASGNGTYANPYGTINAAVSAVRVPGTIVQVANGTYNETVYPGGTNITIRAQNALGAHVEPTGNNNAFSIGGASAVASYITIDGFEVSPSTAGSTGAGIFSNYGANHIIVRNCYVHDCGGNGIGLDNGDYRIVYNNIVCGNAFTATGSDSGLSFWGLCQADNNPGYHSMVCNNIFYANNNNFSGATDGEGIIIDDNRNTQGGHSAGVDPNGVAENDNYTGAYTLIENNLVFNNGGRGIECFLSNNIDVVNNTVFENETRAPGGYGELNANRTNNVTFVNNIACANTAVNSANRPFFAGGETGTGTYGSNFAYYNNIAYDVNNPGSTPPLQISGTITGVQPTFTGNNNINGTNPGFLNAIGNVTLQQYPLSNTTDFQSYLGLNSTSIAINAATDGFTDWGGMVTPAPEMDLKGNVRPSGGGFEVGAYQYTTSP